MWRRVTLKSLDFRTKLILSERRYHHEPIRQEEVIRQQIKNKRIALREKEKGDWRNLTKDEKIFLYRASFCNTPAKVDEPTPEWRTVMGWTTFFMSLGFWMYIIIMLSITRVAPSRLEEQKLDQLCREIDELMKKEATQKEASK